MKTILRALLSRGKFTVLAVVTALTLATASVAVAGSGIGGVFNLGKTNTVNALSRLDGSTLNSMLRINQLGSGTALNLQVQDPNKPPMAINSSTKVDNLNSDLLDGQDSTNFLPRSTYTKEETTFGTDLGGGKRLAETSCNSGDKILGGGYFNVDATGTAVTAIGIDDFHQGYQVQWTNNDGTADEIVVQAYCADL